MRAIVQPDLQSPNELAHVADPDIPRFTPNHNAALAAISSLQI
jgi:hypothetical protein